MSVDPCRLTATELEKAFSNDELTVENYAESVLKRIEVRDAVVKAWAYFNPEHVLEQARALDKVPKDQRGRLHGIGVGIKDVIYTKGMPTQLGSPIYVNDQPEMDAASVKMLRCAGALILGKTTTTEFAASIAGTKTTNPHDPGRTPGGSSSGSGAAVADFQATLSLGTQTGGSIIRPASFNGIYGMKPTWNAISREGQKIYSLDLDTLGFYGRSIEDLALCADVFGLKDDEVPRPISDARGLRVAFLKTMVWDHAGIGTREAFQTGKQLLQNAGAHIEDIDFPDDFARLPDWHTYVLYNEGRVYFRPEYQIAKDKLSDFLQGHVEEVHGYTRKDFLEAFDGVAALRPKWDAIADRYDAVVMPSVPDEAPEGLKSTGSAIFNALWTALHVPVINVPAFKGEHGLPIGLSLTSARYKDQALLEVSKAISKAWIK
ncbi:hypothetical protein DOTSEDRAFT_29506 [Dothistroma septosporum NZE10]|uniref:Amidase domain-containing protein n=1 Tax=Dothistroma septosporum (strain NZE10 / CBS 128990) TaxID=675120 RepID=N1PCC6_DOTSN|nr:hypothetical protein DOTSEDRAFT_29506 [Dothistroma septosporum NZE10]